MYANLKYCRWISRLAAFLCLLLLPLNAFAAPSVVVSIKPLHSLVAAVMEGVAAPGLIVKGAGSEHGYQMKPADARRLANADIVFWAGPQMETFMVRPLDTLAGNALKVVLADTPGIRLLAVRQEQGFEGHDHGHGHDALHSADGKDLHFWLDPQNARAAVWYVADVLAKQDPVNALHYRSNAGAYVQRLDELTAEINRELAPVRGRPFIVFHDAYQYFEKRFAVEAAGSITVSPEHGVGVKRIAQIRATVKKLGSVCVFSEPQFEPRLVATVVEGTQAKTGVLDPLGADIAEGPEQYPALLRNMAASLKNCLG